MRHHSVASHAGAMLRPNLLSHSYKECVFDGGVSIRQLDLVHYARNLGKTGRPKPLHAFTLDQVAHFHRYHMSPAGETLCSAISFSTGLRPLLPLQDGSQWQALQTSKYITYK